MTSISVSATGLLQSIVAVSDALTSTACVRSTRQIRMFRIMGRSRGNHSSPLGDVAVSGTARGTVLRGLVRDEAWRITLVVIDRDVRSTVSHWSSPGAGLDNEGVG